MKFEFDGVGYDSDDMLQPRIEDPYIIALYVTPDYTCVFGTYMDHGSDVVVKRIRGERLEALAGRLELPELHKASGLERMSE